MRNWKYINGAEGVKIGNEKAENTWTLQDAKRNYEAAKKEFEKNGDMFSKRKLDEVKSIIDKEYYAAYKRLEELERKKNDNLYNKGGSGEIPYYNEAKQNYAHWGLLRETIGNDTPSEYAKRPAKIVGENSLPEELEKDVEKKDEEKVEEVKKLEKLGNFKTGTSQLKAGDKVISFGKKGTVKGVYDENADTIYGEPLIEVEFEDGSTKKIGEHYMRKVGNSDTVSEYNAEIQRLTKKAEQLRRMGQGKSAMEVERQIEKLGKELREYTGNKTGNFKTVHIIAPNGEEKDAIDYDQWHYKCLDTGELVEKRFSKVVGNSASDDKFAYVMREFADGKLKTPDGKVVTDPEQAKAIAYSESKKVENGLARARKAIKK